MSRHIAVFGQMGARYASVIADAMATHSDEWVVDIWPCDDDMAARDAIIARCEAAVMSADFILAQGNFGALMGAPNLKILLQPLGRHGLARPRFPAQRIGDLQCRRPCRANV